MMKLHFLPIYHAKRRDEFLSRVLLIYFLEHCKYRLDFYFYLQQDQSWIDSIIMLPQTSFELVMLLDVVIALE